MQLEDEEIASDMRAQIRRDVRGGGSHWRGILDRRGSGRTEEADRKKRPLLGSEQRIVMESGYGAGREVISWTPKHKDGGGEMEAWGPNQ